jgi:predicted aspartyl protease
MKKPYIASSFFLVLLFLSLEAAYAGPRKEKAIIDSLRREAVENRKHGRLDQSNAILEDLLQHYKLSKRVRKDVFNGLSINGLLSDDYRTFCHYAELAYGVDDFYRPLAEIPQQAAERPDYDFSVEFVVDSVLVDGEYLGGLIRIPVCIGGKQEWFVLDNGAAQYCYISESFAEEYGIHILDSKSKATGSTGAKSSFRMGYADSLSIGPLIVRNLVFAVLPDSALENPAIDLSAILGANFFRLAGEMQFLNDERRIIFPAHQEDRESNLTMDSDDHHFAQVVVLGDTLRLRLDLGATNTKLNASFYKRNKKRIQDSYTKNIRTSFGVGGTREVVVYRANDLTFSACGGNFSKERTAIETISIGDGIDYGRLGADFLLSFDKVVINLKKMFLYVE